MSVTTGAVRAWKGLTSEARGRRGAPPTRLPAHPSSASRGPTLKPSLFFLNDLRHY